MRLIRKPDPDIFATKKKIATILKYNQENSGFGLWLAFNKKNNVFVGWVILMHIDQNSSYPIEVGYRLHQEFWGKGYATELTGIICEYAKSLGLKKVCAITIEENKASQKVLEKNQFHYLEDRMYYEMEVKYYEKDL